MGPGLKNTEQPQNSPKILCGGGGRGLLLRKNERRRDIKKFES